MDIQARDRPFSSHTQVFDRGLRESDSLYRQHRLLWGIEALAGASRCLPGTCDIYVQTETVGRRRWPLYNWRGDQGGWGIHGEFPGQYEARSDNRLPGRAGAQPQVRLDIRRDYENRGGL